MVVILLVAFLLIQKLIIFPTFQSLEHQFAKGDIDRVEEVIFKTINLVDRQLYDWSSWDDTYNFIDNVNNKYIEANLNAMTFSNLQINVVYFLDIEFKPIWTRTFKFDLEDIKQVENTTNEENTVQSISLLQNELEKLKSFSSDEPQVIKGMFFQHGMPVAFSIRPVFDSEELGTKKGYMIFGRTLDQFTIEKFSSQLHKKFNIQVMTKNSLSMSDFSNNEYRLESVNADVLKIYKSYLFDDNTVFSISTMYPKVITQSGRRSLEYALLSSLAIGVFMILIIAVLLKQRVFLPLSNLAKQMQDISKSKNYKLRATVSSEDEIGILSKEFNNMLTMIEKNNNELNDANDQITKTNATLEKLTLTDTLTQVANRLGLERKLKVDWEALYREQRPLSIIMIDIDNFKLFNDHYGHPRGDMCLQQVAKIFSNNTQRPRDMVARYGGDEFILVLPEINTKAALHIAQRIQNDIAKCEIEHKYNDVSAFVTISIGIAGVTPSATMSVDSIIHNADKALYTAKRNGRNRIEVSDELVNDEADTDTDTDC